jgi:hypothetical protein
MSDGDVAVPNDDVIAWEGYAKDEDDGLVITSRKRKKTKRGEIVCSGMFCQVGK